MVKPIVLVTVILSGVLSLLAPAGARAETAPIVTVNPTAGQGGTRFSFLADGFRGREKLDMWVNMPDGRVIGIRPDAEAQRTVAHDGRAAWSWTAPEDAQPGAWSLVAHGQRSGIERVALFTILPAPKPAPAGAGVQPEHGTPGMQFVFFASGFDPADPLAFYLTPPNGPETLTAVDQLRIANGRADWSWIAPNDAQPGAWRFRVVGGMSKIERVVTFTIGDSTPHVGVTPGIARAGSLFLFYAEGLRDREPVVFWVNRPDGAVEAVEAEHVSVIDGRADWSWLAPDDAPPGRWSMVVHGTDSGIERLVPFEIQ